MLLAIEFHKILLVVHSFIFIAKESPHHLLIFGSDALARVLFDGFKLSHHLLVYLEILSPVGTLVVKLATSHATKGQ